MYIDLSHILNTKFMESYIGIRNIREIITLDALDWALHTAVSMGKGTTLA